MDSKEVLVLPKNPLSQIFLESYSKRKIKSMKDSFRERLLQVYFSPFDFDYYKYEFLLSKFLEDDDFPLFKGLFAELYVREWFSRAQDFSLESKVNETVSFYTFEGEFRNLDYRTLNSGVVVERRYFDDEREIQYKRRFTEIDLLGSYSNGFEAAFFAEVKSNAKRSYSHKIIRRILSTAILYSHKNNIPLFEYPVFYSHVHGNHYIKNPNNITKKHLGELRGLEEQYGNLVIIEFPLKDMKKASLNAWNYLRRKYHYKNEGFDYSFFRGVVVNS